MPNGPKKKLTKSERKKNPNPRCPKISPEKKEQGYYCDGKGMIRLDFRKNQLYKQNLKKEATKKKETMQPRRRPK